MVKHKKFVKIFLAGYVLMLLSLLPALYFANYSGELARVGNLPEFYFSWSSDQKQAKPENVKSVLMKDADVLVIGDSFSGGLQWQSVLVESGLRVKTIGWPEINGAICADFSNWLQAQGFKKGGLVLIQSAQRGIHNRLNPSVSCQKTQSELYRDNQTQGGPLPSSFAMTKWFDFNESIFSGLNTFKNIFIAKWVDEYNFNPPNASHSIKMVKIKDGCQLFSNRLCDKALFLNQDFDAPELTHTYFPMMEKINRQMSGYRTVWVIVPDKSTIYLNRPGNFWTQLEQMNLGPDLYTPLQLKKYEMKDLYGPNDSHFLSSGYLALGELVLEYLRASH
jgi:hypothetical protein